MLFGLYFKKKVYTASLNSLSFELCGNVKLNTKGKFWKRMKNTKITERSQMRGLVENEPLNFEILRKN